jgi:hypothetical protein
MIRKNPNYSFPFTLDLSGVFFHSGFPIKILYSNLSSFSLTSFFISIWCGVRVMELHSPASSSLVGTLFSNTLF